MIPPCHLMIVISVKILPGYGTSMPLFTAIYAIMEHVIAGIHTIHKLSITKMTCDASSVGGRLPPKHT